jgi:hypothetical protein
MNKRAPAGNAGALLISTSSPSRQPEQAHLRHIGAASSFPLGKKEDAGSNFISYATARCLGREVTHLSLSPGSNERLTV